MRTSCALYQRLNSLLGLIRAGLLRLDEYDVTSFDFDHANEAVAHPAANEGPFKMTVLKPQPRT